MCENLKQGVQRKINFLGLNLFGNKLNIKIIGGGRAAYIKGKTFLSKGCTVSFLAKNISEDILNLNRDKVVILKGEYNKEFIKDGHIVIIAIDDDILRKIIVDNCEELNKIYIDCSNFEEGMGIVQTTRELKNLSFSINTKVAAPALSVLLSNDVENLLRSYDDFAYLVGKIRKIAKNEKYKKEIIKFICTYDFKFFYDIKKEKEVLAMFFGEDVASRLIN